VTGPAAGPPTYFRPGGIPDALEMGAGNPSFAVPTEGIDGPGYHDSPIAAYATRLDAVPGATPDPMREQYFPTRDYRPQPGRPPGEFWHGAQGPGRDMLARHQQEFLDADGITADKPRDRPQSARPARPDEPRWTNRLSPHNYIFTRPFGQDTERYFNGSHFSMADHRRTYAILGMAPPNYRRNTYRADPVPWDSDRIDMPTPSGSATPGRIIAYDLPPTANSAWRL
jgi:hypothetical protein